MSSNGPMKASHINPPKSHKHDRCGHGCFCHDPKLPDCRKCAAARFNAAMAEIHHLRSKGK